MTGTTYKQSKRLFRAGVDVKTSDFFNDGDILMKGNILSFEDLSFHPSIYPIWSMEALYEILPPMIKSDVDGNYYCKEIYDDCVAYTSYKEEGDLYRISFMHKEYEGDLIENLVSMIIWYKGGAKHDYNPSEKFSWVKEC